MIFRINACLAHAFSKKCPRLEHQYLKFTIEMPEMASLKMANVKTIYTDELMVLVGHLKQARLDAGMTQEELAKRVGKRSHSAIVKLEQGQVRVEVLELRRICKVLGVPFVDFIGRLNTDLDVLEEKDKVG